MMSTDSGKVGYSFLPLVFKKIEPCGNSIQGFRVPKPRSGHRIGCDSANLYSFGGYNPFILADDPELQDDIYWIESRPLFRELWRFNFASAAWTRLRTSGTMPEELASHTTLLQEGELVVFGGTGVPFGLTSSNQLSICNLHRLEWRHLEVKGELPDKQYGQAVVLDGNNFYTVGGTTGFEYSIDVHCLDMKTCHWEALFVSKGKIGEPEERYRHEIAFDGHRIYIFGGGTATKVYGFQKVPAFNIGSHKWEHIQTLPDAHQQQGFPAPRRCHAAVQLRNDVYISGGYNGEVIFPDIWRLNLNMMQWTKLPYHMPQPVYFHSASLSPTGCMYIFGGVTKIHENTRTNDIYKTWLTVPSLKEMTWECLIYYIPQLDKISRHRLLESGIPEEFVDRVGYRAVCG